MEKAIVPPGVQEPPPDQVIFRYMSLAKFIALVTTKSIYFTCIDKLKQQDRHEGRVDQRGFTFNGMPEERQMLEQVRSVIGEPTWKAAGNPTSLSFLLDALAQSDHNSYHASCWHIAPHESILMWNRYAPGYESVAIKSRVSCVLESITDEIVMRYGNVSYKPEEMGRQYANSSECFYKHPIYTGENECRFMAYSDNPKHKGVGMLIPVNLQTLINEIYVAPDAEGWFGDLVETFSCNENLPIPVIKTITRPAHAT